MGSDKAYVVLNNEVESFLNGLKYEELKKQRPSEIYGNLYTNLSKLTTKYFDSIDATHNVEINVRKDYELEFIELTGYIKIVDKFVWIDNRYSNNNEVMF